MRSKRPKKEPTENNDLSPFFQKERQPSFFGSENSFFPQPAIQAKPAMNEPTCTACEEEEKKSPRISQGKFIVDDNVTPGAGQMRRSDFLSRLNEEVCVTVNEALAGTPFSSDNCPYIRVAFAKHQNSSALELEQLIGRYAPSTNAAQSIDEIIVQMKARVYEAAKHWATTGGDLSAAAQILGGMPGMSNNEVGSTARNDSGILFKANDGGANPTQSPQSVMQSLGKGNAMDGGPRGTMETALGSSFSDVEIHTDSNAANLSKNMNARAFTVGNHIAFGKGEYQPGTVEGNALLAHELAHVQQQSGAQKNGLGWDGNKNNKELEEEADEAAVQSLMVSGGNGKRMQRLSKNVKGRLKRGLSIQRCSDKPKGKSDVFTYTKSINTPAATVTGTKDAKELARMTISKWKTGEPAAILTYDAKMNVIRELMEGNPGVKDQSLILDLIEQSEVVYVKQFIVEPEIENGVKARFDTVNQQRYEAIKVGRAKEKNTAGASFAVAQIRDLIDEANANALRAHGAPGRHECIGTVRNISLENLYKHLDPKEHARVKKIIATECLGQNSMEEAMTGLEKAKYAEKKQTVKFNLAKHDLTLNIENKSKTIKFETTMWPDTLNGNVWSLINAKVAGQEGWHSFGLAIMNSYHSVTLLVNVRPGGPFLYFVDQTDRSAASTTYRMESTIPGTQQFAPDMLNAYLEFFAHQSYQDYMQGLINHKEERSGRGVKESELSSMQPDSQMEIWHMVKSKLK